MKNKLCLYLFLTCLLLAALLSGCRPFSSKQPLTSKEPLTTEKTTIFLADGVGRCATDQLLVRFRPGADKEHLLEKINGRIIRSNYTLNFDTVVFQPNSKIDVTTARQLLLATNETQVVEPNFILSAELIPNDQYFDYEQWGPKMIKAESAWEISKGDESVFIAIVDTGVDHEHPDLSGQVIAGYNSFYEESGYPGDDHGHGTHVAGIVAAIGNNGQGVAGVAWECKLLAVKVLDGFGQGPIDRICAGIVWAVDNGADVINLSLGGPGYSRLLHDAVDYAIKAGVVVVAAAGNDTKTYIQYPAAYSGVIAVGAINAQNKKASFSNSSNYLALAAPGERIFSTLPDGRYGFMDGTSMATPFVSGAAALVKAVHGRALSTNEVRSQLLATAEDIDVPGWDQGTGAGLLNLDAALANLQPNNLCDILVTIDDGQGNPQGNAHLLLKDVQGRGIYSALTNEQGEACFWSLDPGTYTLVADKFGLLTSDAINISSGQLSTVLLTLPFLDPVPYYDFFEGAEGTDLVLPDGTWGITSASKHSGSYSWTDSPSGEYLNNTQMALMTLPIDLSGTSNPSLSFWHRYELEEYYDFVSVEISNDGGNTWGIIDNYSCENLEWTNETILLNEYVGQNIILRFLLTSDFSYTYDGYYLDDLTIVDNH